MKNEIIEKKFTSDFFGEKYFSGYSIGKTWNGWAYPYFSLEEGQKIVSAQNEFIPNSAFYDTNRNCFVFKINDEIEEYATEDLGNLKLFAIGSGAWIWEEAT